MTERFDNARRRGLYDRPLRPGQTDADKRLQDFLALEAELRVCAFFGIARPMGGTDGRPDPHFDLRIPTTGELADVKHTKTVPGRRYGATAVGYPTLNLSTWKRHRAELYILVVGDSPEEMDTYAWVSGYARLAELLKAPLVQGQWGRPYHALGFDYLHPLEDLL